MLIFLDNPSARDENQLVDLIQIVSDGNAKMGEAMRELYYKKVPIEDKIAERKRYPSGKIEGESKTDVDEKSIQKVSRFAALRKKMVPQKKRLAQEKLQAQKKDQQIQAQARQEKRHAKEQEIIYEKIVEGLGSVAGPIAYAIGNPADAMRTFVGMHHLYGDEIIRTIAGEVGISRIGDLFDYLADGIRNDELNVRGKMNGQEYMSGAKLRELGFTK